MKKKLFAAAMAGTMVLSLAACGGSKPAETTAAPAADKTEAAAESKAEGESTEAAAESGSTWEPNGTVSIIVPAGAGGDTDLYRSYFCSVRKRENRR
ncbi:MAG: hypothetical protein ACLTA4_11960 [Clostridium sp.]